MVYRSNNNANANGGVSYAYANNDSANVNSNIGSRLANNSKDIRFWPTAKMASPSRQSQWGCTSAKAETESRKRKCVVGLSRAKVRTSRAKELKARK